MNADETITVKVCKKAFAICYRTTVYHLERLSESLRALISDRHVEDNNKLFLDDRVSSSSKKVCLIYLLLSSFISYDKQRIIDDVT